MEKAHTHIFLKMCDPMTTATTTATITTHSAAVLSIDTGTLGTDLLVLKVPISSHTNRWLKLDSPYNWRKVVYGRLQREREVLLLYSSSY